MRVLHIGSIDIESQASTMLYPNLCHKQPRYNEVAVYCIGILCYNRICVIMKILTTE